MSPLWLTRHILFNFSTCKKKRKKKAATQLSLIGCESLGCLCISAVTVWIFHYGALGHTLRRSAIFRARHPWQLGRPLSPQKCAFNWVTSNRAVKYNGGVNKTGQQGTRTTSCSRRGCAALGCSVRVDQPMSVRVLMNKITGLEVFFTRSLGECVIGYDEPFLRLHQLGEEACLWCAEITGAERSHKLCLNTY